jgi:hypothetical protein
MNRDKALVTVAALTCGLSGISLLDEMANPMSVRADGADICGAHCYHPEACGFWLAQYFGCEPGDLHYESGREADWCSQGGSGEDPSGCVRFCCAALNTVNTFDCNQLYLVDGPNAAACEADAYVSYCG